MDVDAVIKIYFLVYLIACLVIAVLLFIKLRFFTPDIQELIKRKVEEKIKEQKEKENSKTSGY